MGYGVSSRHDGVVTAVKIPILLQSLFPFGVDLLHLWEIMVAPEPWVLCTACYTEMVLKSNATVDYESKWELTA